MAPTKDSVPGPNAPTAQQNGPADGQPPSGSALYPIPSGRPLMKMKRTGKTGVLLPGQAGPSMKRYSSSSSSTISASPTSTVAPSAPGPQPRDHSQINPAPDVCSNRETDPASEKPTVLGMAGVTQSVQSDRPSPVRPSQAVPSGTRNSKPTSAKNALQNAATRSSSPDQVGRKVAASREGNDCPAHILKAPSGRLYSFWYSMNPGTSAAARETIANGVTSSDDTGRLVPGDGTLFPDGYKLDSSVRENIWICPIRSCRRLRVYMKGLGKHFKVRLSLCFSLLKWC